MAGVKKAFAANSGWGKTRLYRSCFFMSKNSDLFAKKFAALLLTQAGILPESILGLTPKKSGFQSVGEILNTKEYWQKKLNEWKNQEN